jgi:proteasome lid subunit RPN8/RPN11
MIVYISIETKQCIIDYAAASFPKEACGVLLGTIEDKTIQVEAFVSIDNRAKQPNQRFEFDPKQWIEVFFQAQKNRLNIVGLLHSHPIQLAIPSLFDLNTAWHHIPTHWILGPIQPIEQCELCAFQYFDTGSTTYTSIPIVVR